jgi:AmmeMemoRadiSam system protein A/AmmeMemoRadiSam system protein B
MEEGVNMSIIGAVMVPHPPIILPEIGKGEEHKIQKTLDAYDQAAKMIADLDPETVVISSPHNVMYYDYFNISGGDRAYGDFGQFRAPQVSFDVKYDQEMVNSICRQADEQNFPAGTLGTKSELDHGFMIPLYFLKRQGFTDFDLVRIGLSGQSLEDHYRLGMMVKQAAEETGKRVAFIASGDLSHKTRAEGPYGFDPHGPQYDDRIMDVMGRAAFNELFDFSDSFCEQAAECGHRSFVMMAGALDRTKVEPARISHEDVFGVGYGVCTYKVLGEDPSRNFLDQQEDKESERLAEKKAAEDSYVRLARVSVESWVSSHQKVPVPDSLEEGLTKRRAGAFVTLHKDGRLRGCIGTIQPVRSSLAEEIIENGISACSRDPRFPEVQPSELPFLEYSVDVLDEPEPIESKDQLDVKKYGVIVSKGGRRGLLLPNLDGVDSVDQQIAIAKEKAGIGKRELGVQLERFQVVRHF